MRLTSDKRKLSDAQAEMLKPSSAIMGAGLGQDVALITDGRFSGGSHGFLIGRAILAICSAASLIPATGHIVPEAQEGGPIGLLQDGDEIVIDAETRRLDVSLSDVELEGRRATWKAPELKYKKGTLAKYARYACHRDWQRRRWLTRIIDSSLMPVMGASRTHRLFRMISGNATY